MCIVTSVLFRNKIRGLCQKEIYFLCLSSKINCKNNKSMRCGCDRAQPEGYCMNDKCDKSAVHSLGPTVVVCLSFGGYLKRSVATSLESYYCPVILCKCCSTWNLQQLWPGTCYGAAAYLTAALTSIISHTSYLWYCSQTCSQNAHSLTCS